MYIDNVIIFLKDFIMYIKYFYTVFSLFVKIGISIKVNKVFLNYFTVQFLD